MEYVRTMLPEMLARFGPDETRALVGRAARLVGMQCYDETAGALGVVPGGAAGFARYLAGMARAQGESVEVDSAGEGAIVRQDGWRLMRGIEPLDPAGFDAWNELWRGALSVHDRRLTLEVSRRGADGARAVEWRIGKRP